MRSHKKTNTLSGNFVKLQKRNAMPRSSIPNRKTRKKNRITTQEINSERPATRSNSELSRSLGKLFLGRTVQLELIDAVRFWAYEAVLELLRETFWQLGQRKDRGD